MAFTVTARHNMAPDATTSYTTRNSTSATPTASSLLLWIGANQVTGAATPTLGTPSGGSLTYTLVGKIDGASAPDWGGISEYQQGTGLWSAPVGASPSAFAITQTINTASSLCGQSIDITGHNAASPIVQTKTASASYAGGTNSGHNLAVTFDTAPTEGNLIVVAVASGADSGGGFSTPSGYTAAVNQNGQYLQSVFFTKTAGASESSTVTISDLGDSVGSGIIILAEIAADAGGGTGATVTPSAIAAVAAVPAPAVSAASGATAAPSAVGAVSTVQAPTVSAGTSATVTPSTAAATVGIIDVPVSLSAYIEVAETQATAAVPAPSVSVGSNATVAPSVAQATSAIGTPSVLAGQSASISPAVTTALSAVGEVTVTGSASSTVTPGAVSASAAVQPPVVSAGVSIEVSPTSTAAAGQVPAPTVSASSDVVISPTVAQALAAVPAPSVQAVRNAAITASTVSSVVSVPTPPFVGEVVTIVTPASVAVVVSVPPPSVSGTTPRVRLLWTGVQFFGPATVPKEMPWKVLWPTQRWPGTILVGHDGSITYKQMPSDGEIRAAKYALRGGHRHEMDLGSELYDILASNGYQFEEVLQ